MIDVQKNEHFVIYFNHHKLFIVRFKNQTAWTTLWHNRAMNKQGVWS